MTQERLHLLIHIGEIIGLLVLLLTSWRNADQIASIIDWARGVDHVLSGGEDDQVPRPLDDPRVERWDRDQSA